MFLSRLMRLAVICITFIFATCACAFAQQHTVPMEVRGGLPFVQVMVNGKGPFTFGIDSGTGGQALVSRALAEQLKLPVTGEMEIGDPSGRNPRKVPVLRVDSLRVGEVDFKAVEANEYPGTMAAGTDGILGFPLFHEWLLTLNYRDHKLTLARGTLSAPDGDEVLTFRMPDNVPVIDLVVEGKKIEAHLDTRGRGLTLPEGVAKELKFTGEPMVIGRGRTVLNEFEIRGGQLASDVRVGGYTFVKPFVALNPIFPIANFGASALQTFAITFDQKNLRVRLAAAEKNIVLPGPPVRTPAAAGKGPAQP